MARVVIIGAGHAGGTAAALLRQYGFEGEIVLIGEEPLAPYQRPPLSKAWLKGEADGEALILKEPTFYPDHSIDLRLNTTATAVDRDDRFVTLSDGSRIDYDWLILATGSETRKLPIPGADHPAMLELRTAADADRIKAALTPGKRLIVVGAGYIGLEVAASARALGCEATVLERESRVLARVASPPLSAFFERLHRERGVEIRLNVNVERFEDGTRVVLAGGETLEGDAILIGVGAKARDELAAASGLGCSNGVIVDGQARTSDRNVFAIGDCSFRPLPLYDAETRLESVPNALEQAKQAASAITQRTPPPAEVPWFWSDQYEIKLQIAGLPYAVDRLVVRGRPEENRFAVFHMSDDLIQAVEAVNAPQEFMGGRLLIGRRAPVDPGKLADAGVSMKDVTA
ncbi:MAG: FAD-dependent oxidoreductase [Caulobacteraceae bacterium]|nr:FAD-dependent oxidoreductase [Caulobacteraceae bacterium]